MTMRSMIGGDVVALVFWPHHQVAMEGSSRSSPSSWRQMVGHEGEQARVSRMPEPSALTMVTDLARSASTRPGVPICERLVRVPADRQRRHRGGARAR